MEDTKDEFEKDIEAICKGADQGFVGGMLLMGGVVAATNGYIVTGALIGVIGAMIYVDAKSDY